MPTDAVVVLKDDHQKLRKLFDDFKTVGPNATVTKGKISKNIIEQLTIHTYLENEIILAPPQVYGPACSEVRLPLGRRREWVSPLRSGDTTSFALMRQLASVR